MRNRNSQSVIRMLKYHTVTIPVLHGMLKYHTVTIPVLHGMLKYHTLTIPVLHGMLMYHTFFSIPWRAETVKV
jgi:hypothetical protein